MSNRPNFRKAKPMQSVQMQTALFERIAASPGGQQVIEEVAKIYEFCEEHELPFEGVSDLFNKFAAKSYADLPTTVRAFKDLLFSRWEAIGAELNAPGDQANKVYRAASKLLLPGDKDFHVNDKPTA